jgi:glycosyltransferase involved in cell wall biosynthesis
VGGDFERKGGRQLLDIIPSLEGNVELVAVTKSVVPRVERMRVVNDLEPNDPRLIELYRSSDVFALPSRAETFGIAAAEAAASGLPVVASDVGGLSEIVEHNVTGRVIPVGDGEALATSLRAFQDPDVRLRMARAARRRAEQRLNAELNARRLLELVDAAQP